jgi:hypothetical protein
MLFMNLKKNWKYLETLRIMKNKILEKHKECQKEN